MEPKKIVVGMSGGVDSSMTLLLLKKAGWAPVGVSLKLPIWDDPQNLLRENVCCSTESLDIAKGVCEKLGVPYHQYDVKKDFQKYVMDYFISELKSARTPNPCAICNRYLKFKKLFDWAHENGIEHIATGHYASTCLNKKTGKYELLQAKDKSKDQTYGLCLLPNEWLRYIHFPLGIHTKDEVYKVAKREGFDIFLKRKQSQNLCFVAGKALPKYVGQKLGASPGEIMDENEKILGTHNGLHFFTIGQKKGLNLRLPGAFYVKEFDRKNNRLIVTKDQDSIFQKRIIISNFNFVSGVHPEKPTEVWAKIRYVQPLSKAILYPEENGEVKIAFRQPQYATCQGQFCVAYEGNVCLGGGVIS